MIIEYTHSERDLKKECYDCKWLELDEDYWYGYCKCEFNKVKFRNRSITDKACSCKNYDK